MMRTLFVVLALSPVALGAQTETTAAQQQSARYGHTTAVPAAIAMRRGGAILLDGKLDESAWRNAQPISDFTQFDPDEGKPASQRAADSAFGDLQLWRDRGALYAARPDNIFLIKASWWTPM
jgi:hypothetical protein